MLADTLPDYVTSPPVGGAPVVLAEVFAPSALPTNVRLEWRRDGHLLRVSREVGITAHAVGFRVWDAYRPESGAVPPGHYRVVLRTAGRRVFRGCEDQRRRLRGRSRPLVSLGGLVPKSQVACQPKGETRPSERLPIEEQRGSVLS